MKTGILIIVLAAFISTAWAQENDDMYFNAKDREKLKAGKTKEALAKANKKKVTEEDEYVNQTDSYSARNVNPEYAARSNAQSALYDNEDYFIQDYRTSSASNLNNWNNNFNSWYGNPWYTSSWFGPSINAWNSQPSGFSGKQSHL